MANDSEKKTGTKAQGRDDPDETVLKVDHVSKYFKLPTEQATGLKQAFINWTKGIKGYRKQQVLDDISFEVKKGDFFGIVGRNGSGKSTLLKLISGIYYPNGGSIQVKGKLVPFIELGVGFNPELTGRENVYLNGSLLGFTREEVDAMYDDIVEFAELGDFMDQKLKNYSSGMQVRLAFSVAIKAQGDILVLDEVLAVGDEAFQRKCNDYFMAVKKDPSKTVILVTHDMESIKKYCDHALLIKDGKIVISGDKDAVAEQYTLDNFHTDKKPGKDGVYENGLSERCPLLKTIAVSPQVVSSADEFKFDVEYRFDGPEDFYLAIALHDIRRGGITYDTGMKGFRLTEYGHHTVHFSMPLNLFNDGEFRLVTSLRIPNAVDPNATDALAVAIDSNACEFAVRDPRNSQYALLSDRAMTIRQI